jgi:arginine exporter protein ArgO
VTEALWAGLVAGYGIAVPVGAIAPLLVGLSARLGLRVGAAAALGVATADGVYALLAVVGGVALAEAIEPVSRPLRLLAAAVLAAIAVRTAVVAVRRHQLPAGAADQVGAGAATGARGSTRVGVGLGVAPSGRAGALRSPARAYAGLLGLTLLNPATVVYFAALVLGERAPEGGSAAAVFVAAAFAASASWQLVLAGGGAALGRVLTSPAGRLGTAVASSAVVGALALAVLLGV